MAEPDDTITVFKINNENEAWEALERVLDSGVPEGQVPLFDFEGWPEVRIYLPRTPVKGSISPSMMEAFIELQKTIYRAHTLVTADTGDLRALTKNEKETLEFRVKVTDGSSNYEVDLTKIAEQLGTEALSKMDSVHIVITVLGIALIVGGVIVFQNWLKSRADIRGKEIDDADKRRWFEAHQSQLQHDEKRYRILLDAFSRQPVLQEVEAAAEGARNEMVKAIASENGGTIAGIDIDPSFASELVSQKRQAGEQIRLAGLYRVAKVDTTVPEGFRVTLDDMRDGPPITASMQDVILSAEQRDTISKAEWNKRPVFLEMTARRLRNRIVDAIVINAREASDDEAQRLVQRT